MLFNEDFSVEDFVELAVELSTIRLQLVSLFMHVVIDLLKGLFQSCLQSVSLLQGILFDCIHLIFDKLQFRHYNCLFLSQTHVLATGLVGRIRVSHIYFNNLLIVVAPLNITGDDAGRAQWHARFSVEELVALLMVLAFAKVFEFIALFFFVEPCVLLQYWTSFVELSIMLFAEECTVVYAIDFCYRWLWFMLLLAVTAESATILVDGLQDVHFTCHSIEQAATFFIKDSVSVGHHVALLAR